MILIDLNQIIISNLMQQINCVEKDVIELNFLRHLILNSLRSYNNKFKDKYGEMVICNDTSNYWRKDLFPHYKANRKKSRANSAYDWNHIFNVFNMIKDEIAEHFPYKFLAVDRCEADDIIAVLTKTFHKEEPILIISSDRDFIQLYRYPNVQQYSPLHKMFIPFTEPRQYLINKLVGGDSGDGVPNVLSDDDVFINPDKRQRRVTKKFLAEFSEEKMGPKVAKNWERNRLMIDFDCIPKQYVKEILDQYNEAITGTYEKAYQYLLEHNLKLLLMKYGEF